MLYKQMHSDMHSGMWVSYLVFVFVVLDRKNENSYVYHIFVCMSVVLKGMLNNHSF
jgi:hypothetical protein